MAPVTYRQRIQRVLSAVAKDDKVSIDYEELVERVHDSIKLDLRKVSSVSKAHINKALGREKNSRRIDIEPTYTGVVTLMPAGRQFFKAFGGIPLYAAGSRQMKRLTMKQLRDETEALKSLLQEVTQALRDGDPHCADLTAFEGIPAAVARVVTRIKAVGEQNTELAQILAEDRAIERLL